MRSSSSSEVLVDVNNLNFYYPIDIYHSSNSLRDLFISSLTSPLDFLSKKHEYHHVLNSMSFTIYGGDRIGILGINGAGKTTLCRCITDILKTPSGIITRYGNIRSVFNTAVAIIPELTGRENAFLLAKFTYPKLSGDQLSKLVEDAISFSEINSFVDVPYKNYSKGMQARLTLSIISAYPTDVLILDEVLEGADQFFRVKIKKRMLKMITSSKSLVFVSHSTEQIREICNRVIIINGNKIVFDGSVTKGIHIYNLLGQ